MVQPKKQTIKIVMQIRGAQGRIPISEVVSHRSSSLILVSSVFEPNTALLAMKSQHLMSSFI